MPLRSMHALLTVKHNCNKVVTRLLQLLYVDLSLKPVMQGQRYDVHLVQIDLIMWLNILVAYPSN